LSRVRPDLVIVNYGLLGGSGLRAAQMATEANVPVIVMSGYLTVRDEIEPLGLRYLQKPFILAECSIWSASWSPAVHLPMLTDLGRRRGEANRINTAGCHNKLMQHCGCRH
jgi:hypothetical protein